MKKVTLITLIALALLFNKANAQTIVSAGGKTVQLTTEQVIYLHTFNNPAIDSAIKKCINIKYNSTADLIIMLLSNRKMVKRDNHLLTKQN